jgi:hypothetical protein
MAPHPGAIFHFRYPAAVPTLLDVVTQLSTYDAEHVIYAARPWSASCAAAVIGLADPDGVPARPPDGLERLVDVADAVDFFSGGWADSIDDEARCERLIQYATYDA